MTRVKSLATKFSRSRSPWLSKMLVVPLAVTLSVSPITMLGAASQAAPEASGGAARSASLTTLPIPNATAATTTGSTAVATPDTTTAPAPKQVKSFSSFDVLPLPTAVQFPVVFDTEIDSRTARQGNVIECHLKEDLVFEGELVAPAGSVVLGHIDHYVKSRTMTQAMASKDGRFHKTSIVKIVFDEIITPEQEHIKIEGILSKQKATFGDKVEREIVIDKKGLIDSAEPRLNDDTMVGAQVVNFAVGTGLSQLGTIATFGVLPVVMGGIGFVNPSIITMKAVSKEDHNPRLRGLTMGVVEALPGGPVIQSFIYHGSELNVKVGDELLIQAHSPYNDQTTTTGVSAKIFDGLAVKSTAAAQGGGRHYYPKYQPKYTPKTGNKVLGITTTTEDRFGLWH